MTTDRCPACGAAVTAGAPWCTLCYTDLRVPAATVPAEPIAVTVPSRAAERRLEADALAPDALAPDPVLDAPIARAAPVARLEAPGWPCTGCGAVVPMAEDVCTGCGRAFLPSDAMPSLALPVVGDLSRMERGQRIGVTIVAALLVMGLFVALAFIGGSIL